MTIVISELSSLSCCAAEGRDPQDSYSPVHWSTCYCLQIDYLAVARAAMACGAHFTALLYIEHWTEQRYGRLQYVDPEGLTEGRRSTAGSSIVAQLQALTRGSSSSGTAVAAAGGSSSGGRGQGPVLRPAALSSKEPEQQQQQEGERLGQLLMDLYSNVNEPDGVYAVAAAFGGSSNRLQLLQHEGKWGDVASSEDELLQSLGRAGSAKEKGKCL